MQENLILISCGLLGVVFQSMLKVRGLLKDAQVANITWSWKKDYLIKDAPSIILALLSVLIWYYTYGEVGRKYPGLIDFKRISFVVMGGVGSFAIQYVFGTAKDRIRKIVDKKTDIADGKEKP